MARRRVPGSLNNGFWRDDVSQYWVTQYPEAFVAAIEQATADGTIDDWTFAMLLGKVPPPGHEWHQPRPQNDVSQDDSYVW